MDESGWPASDGHPEPLTFSELPQPSWQPINGQPFVSHLASSLPLQVLVSSAALNFVKPGPPLHAGQTGNERPMNPVPQDSPITAASSRHACRGSACRSSETTCTATWSAPAS